jgi:predicted nucleic acid-binding Zn ribbon protein
MRRKAPQQLGAAIQSALARLDGEGHFEIVRLVRVWPEVVGDAIGRRTEIAGLKFHAAIVKVSGAMWLQELNLMKPQILERLQAALASDAVRDLRFVQGRLSRRGSHRLRSVPRGPRHAIDLPAIEDRELREAFQNLIEAWGRSPR